MLALVPQADPSPYGDGTNVAGATGPENGYFVDGIHVTDPISADGSVNLPYNFVREVQVATGGYRAEYGRTQGAVVNVITNSGGNEFHGQLLGFLRNDQLRATPLWGVGQSRVEKFSQYDVGVGLGGPIKRDRLWFYAAYNPTVERSDVSFPGIPAQPDSRTSHLFAGKLTGRLGPATDLTITVLGDPSTRDYVGSSLAYPPMPANVGEPSAVQGRLVQGGVAGTAQVRHQIGDGILLTGSLARLERKADNTPPAGPTEDFLTLARLDDYPSNTASGNYGASFTNHASRTAAQATLTLLTGGHAVKLGAEYEDNAMRNALVQSFVTKGDATSYTWFQGLYHARAHNRVPAAYLQDTWAATRRLTVDVGLRGEAQFLSGDTGTAWSIAPELAPRLGLVFQPGELGSQKVYVSGGRFYEQIALQSVTQYLGVNTQISIAYPQNPLVDTTGGVMSGTQQIGEQADLEVRGQHYDELTAGYERRLGRAYRIGLRGTYRTLRWVVEDGALDLVSPFIVGNPGRGALAFLPRAKRDYAALELVLERGEGPFTFLASYVLSRNYGNYTGLFATDLLAVGDNGGPQFDFPEQVANATGPLPNDRRHVLKFSGSYRFPFGLTVGTSAFWASGVPLSEYGTGPYWPYWTFVRPRGTSGRTPTTGNLDLRLAYDVAVPSRSRVRPRVLLDVFNAANHRGALTLDQRHYTAPDFGGLNPNYLDVAQYQAPLSARLGLMLNF